MKYIILLLLISSALFGTADLNEGIQHEYATDWEVIADFAIATVCAGLGMFLIWK